MKKTNWAPEQVMLTKKLVNVTSLWSDKYLSLATLKPALRSINFISNLHLMEKLIAKNSNTQPALAKYLPEYRHKAVSNRGWNTFQTIQVFLQ